MKLFLVAALLFFGLLTAARAQSDADDKYIGIYSLIQQADQFAGTGDPGEALAAFGDAQNQLQLFQRQYPNWNPNIINYRLSHVADRIAELKARIPAAPVTPVETAPAVTPGANTATSSAELDGLHAQLQAALAANESLQAKLKEALAVQPAAVDPQELERAREKIRSLMKENDLLKASQTAAGQPRVETQVVTNLQIVTNFTTVIVTNTPAEVTNYATTFVTNVVEVPVPDTNALEMLRLERIAAVKNFNDEHDRAAQLDDEIRRLRQGSSSVGTNLVNVYVTNTTTLVLTNITEIPVLVTNVVTNFTEVPVAVTNFAMVIPIIEENTRLKADLAALRSGTSAAAPDAGKTAEELNQSRAQIASLQTALEAVGQEKILLEHKVQELSSMTNSSAENKANYEARIRELTQERDDLIEKLDLLNKQKAGAKNSEVMSQLSALNSEVTVLRSRLAVVEAQPVPYSTDELALFKNTVPQLANPDAGKKSIKEMPSGTAELVASAQGHFAQREYDQAEADYQKILDRDQNNGIALANLATIELQENKLDAAEKHIKAALVQSPDDAYNLSTLGYLKFRQEKFDEALNALSRAAQIDPNNPEIQNYLGVTLSHQGQRKAAEAALRRAIQLAPNYAPAHNNLAVIYLSQTPPLAELARWHYQKAVDAGQPRNPDLEKMLADKGAPVAP